MNKTLSERFRDGCVYRKHIPVAERSKYLDEGRCTPGMADQSCRPCQTADEVRALEQQAPKWVAVGERLPDRDSTVLVVTAATSGNKAFLGRRVSHPAYYDEDGKWCNADNLTPMRVNNGMWEVTHWMPLPSPPSEGGE